MYTEELLDILDEYNVKATFFVVKNNRRTTQLQHIVKRGHSIGLHSASHVYKWIYSSDMRFQIDVNGVHDWVENITGVDTRLYRFPGGSSNNMYGASKDECIRFLYDNGYEYFDWNAESRDAENIYLTPEQLNNNVMNFVRNNEGNSIVLMHDLDDHHNTTLALPALIETLQSEGYELCALDMDSPTFHHYEIDTDEDASE
jgi:peptidoglycan/xylan/chitin deacetylase (PgdA/CDA1 family)